MGAITVKTTKSTSEIGVCTAWLFILVLLAAAACSTNGQADVVATPTTAPTLAATDIAVPTPSVTYVPPPTETQALTPVERLTLTFVATVLTARSAAGATADFIETSSAATPSEPIPTGILDGAGVRADAHYLTDDQATFENMWRGVLSDHIQGASVWAGALRSDPTQGLVVVNVEGPVLTYLSHVKAGSLHIVAEQNLRLTLRSANGTTFYFDVPGQKFVSSLTVAVPTVTPFRWPTPTPTAVPPTAPPVPSCTAGPTPSHATGEPNCLAY